MKKIMILLVTVIALSAPAAVYASQSISENLREKQLAAKEYVVDNHEYRQQLWLDSAEENHSNQPKLWL